MSLAGEQRQFIAELFGTESSGELSGEHEGARSALAEFYRQKACSRLRGILEPAYGEVLSSIERSASLQELELYALFLSEDPPRSMDPIEIVSRFLAWLVTSVPMVIDFGLLEQMAILRCEYGVENAHDAGWKALDMSEVLSSSSHDVELHLAPWVSKLGVLKPVPERECDGMPHGRMGSWCTRDADGLACWPEISAAADEVLARLDGFGGLELESTTPVLRELVEHRFLARSLASSPT